MVNVRDHMAVEGRLDHPRERRKRRPVRLGRRSASCSGHGAGGQGRSRRRPRPRSPAGSPGSGARLWAGSGQKGPPLPLTRPRPMAGPSPRWNGGPAKKADRQGARSCRSMPRSPPCRHVERARAISAHPLRFVYKGGADGAHWAETSPSASPRRRLAVMGSADKRRPTRQPPPCGPPEDSGLPGHAVRGADGFCPPGGDRRHVAGGNADGAAPAGPRPSA